MHKDFLKGYKPKEENAIRFDRDEVLEFIKSCVKESRSFYTKLDNQYSTKSTNKTIKDHNKVLNALNDITSRESLADELDFILEAINE